MALTVPVPISPAPEAPDRTDRATFGDRTDAWLDWEEESLYPGINSLCQGAFSNAQQAHEDALAAGASALAASQNAGTVATTLNHINVVVLPEISGKANTAATGANVATGAAADALAASTAAQALAQQTAGNVGTTGRKSAYAYAVDAKASADSAAAIVGPAVPSSYQTLAVGRDLRSVSVTGCYRANGATGLPRAYSDSNGTLLVNAQADRTTLMYTEPNGRTWICAWDVSVGWSQWSIANETTFHANAVSQNVLLQAGLSYSVYAVGFSAADPMVLRLPSASVNLGDKIKLLNAWDSWKGRVVIKRENNGGVIANNYGEVLIDSDPYAIIFECAWFDGPQPRWTMMVFPGRN